MPTRDGMLLEDYVDALSFRVYGTPEPDKWVDELKAEAAAASLIAAT